ncbi:MAG: Flp pilus assembly complex ATPase component TadA [Candidatus Pacebacteria bacterium]|nr:Flp pilus assembly complex ATPase component TadA [Candidatus Paceibacterota bacterium]
MPQRIGNILLEKGLLTAAQLDSAVHEQQETQQYLGKILVDSGVINERQLLTILAEQQDIPFAELRDREVPAEVIRSVPAKFAWHYNIMPVDLRDSVLTIAISDPFDGWPIDDLQTNLGFRVEKVLATSADIHRAIRRHYGVAADTIERIMSEESRTEDEELGLQSGMEIEDLERMAEATSVIRVVNQILHQAIGQRATDIHLEHYRDQARLRYRVDGILRDARVSGDIKYLYPAVVSRIKIMSGLDIIERRLPQDGRARVKIGASEYDLRVSVMPTVYGENVVVRVLPTTMLFSLTDLGMAEEDLRKLSTLIESSNGILFVTGPTGSGKTTTLYAALKKLNVDERKLVTIEDPVEYELNGVSQVQVKPGIDLTFARTLRSMLRHDPDVVMVGEIRDQETANIAIRAALTGHLVLSTLHTNDAAGGVTRLLDIGVEPYLIASSVRAFMAQRLVRVLCPNCKERVTLDHETLAFFGQQNDDGPVTAYRSRGCESCEHTGYSGRTGIYEVLPVTETVRDMILHKASSEAIKRKAMDDGFKTMKLDGYDKILAGMTTTEEVLRVTQMEG